MDFRNFRDSDRDHDRPFKYQCRLAFGERDQRTEAGWLFGGTKCASKLINVRPGLGKTAGVVLAWLAAIAGNMELPVRGVVNGGAVPPVAVGGKSLGCEALSTDCRRMGRSANTHESYTRGVLRLLDHYGPFCLAFFEAIFCAADMRASARAKCAHFSAQS